MSSVSQSTVANYMDNIFGDSVGIFYVPEWNAFIDEVGFIVWNIFEYITPNDLRLFKHNKEYMVVPHNSIRGVLVELFYQDTDDDVD